MMSEARYIWSKNIYDIVVVCHYAYIYISTQVEFVYATGGYNKTNSSILIKIEIRLL